MTASTQDREARRRVAGPARARVRVDPSAPIPEDDDRPRALRARTVDDIASVVGSAAASLAFVWVLYARILPTNGGLGFLACWYGLFLVVYGVVTSFSAPRTAVVDRLVSAVVHGAVVIVGFALASTLVFIFVKGWPAMHHLNFYTQDMAGVRPTAPLTRGGIRHALVGSAIEVAIAVAIALPVGLTTAVYMTEVGGRLSQVVRTVVEAMTALPDILAGLFIYTILIVGLHWKRDGFAVSLALAATMVPVIARSAEVVLKVVPGGLREASRALGASQLQTTLRVVVPTARTGLASSLILGVARVTGETAPLLILSGASTFMNSNPFRNPMNSLPLFIYTAVRSGEPRFEQRGFGAAAVLITIVLVLFGITRVLARNRVATR